MITVTDIFDGKDSKGQYIGKVAKCDCESWLSWKEFFVGILSAIIIFVFIMV